MSERMTRRTVLARGGAGAVALSLVGPTRAGAAGSPMPERYGLQARALVEAMARQPAYGIDPAEAPRFVADLSKMYASNERTRRAVADLFDTLPSVDGREFASAATDQRVAALRSVLRRANSASSDSPALQQGVRTAEALAAVDAYFGHSHYPRPWLILEEA